MIRKRILAVCVLICVFSVLLSTSASAYRFFPGNLKLDKTKQMTYYVHKDFSDTTFADMNHALYKWYQACGYNLMRRHPTERHSRSDFNSSTSRDNLNLVYRVPVGVDEYVAANRLRSHSANGMIFESDINFNMSKKFANSAQPGAFDSYSIFFARIRTYSRLDDIDIPTVSEADAVMIGNWELRKNTTTYRNLRNDDIQGAKALYS